MFLSSQVERVTREVAANAAANANGEQSKTNNDDKPTKQVRITYSTYKNANNNNIFLRVVIRHKSIGQHLSIRIEIKI